MGQDGEALVRRILDQARELAGQPADILKMVEGHHKELSKKVMLREMSADLEKEQAAERTARLKVMEVEVDKLRTVQRKGDMAGITGGHRVLKDQLDEDRKDVEADEEGGVASSLSGNWREAAISLTKKILEKVGLYGRSVADEKEDALDPLRRAMGKVASLNEAVARMEGASEEEGLWELGWRLSEVRKELMSLGRVLMMSQDPPLAAEAHELIEDAFWTFIYQKWKDSLNVAAAEPASWDQGSNFNRRQGTARREDQEKPGARKTPSTGIHAAVATGGQAAGLQRIASLQVRWVALVCTSHGGVGPSKTRHWRRGPRSSRTTGCPWL